MLAGILCALFLYCPTQPHSGPQAAESGVVVWEATAPVVEPLVARWEGTGPTFPCAASAEGVCVRAYLDTIPNPDVPTLCFGNTRVRNPDGSTRPVRVGETRTIEQCRALLREDLVDYWRGYRGALTPSTVATALTPKRDAAFTSLAWNIGVGAVTRSTALRMLNEGRIAAACEALTWWNKSGGRVVRGLVNRRSEEKELCLEGVV